MSHPLSLLFIFYILDRVAVLQDGAPGLDVVNSTLHICPLVAMVGTHSLIKPHDVGSVLVAVTFVSMRDSAVESKMRG